MQATFASRCLTARGLLRRRGEAVMIDCIRSSSRRTAVHFLSPRSENFTTGFSLRIGVSVYGVLIGSLKQGSLPNGYALYSTSTGNEVVKQGANQGQAAIVAKERNSGEQVADTKILSTLVKYLWMKDNLEFRLRVLNVQVPFMFKLAVDWLTTVTGNASALASFTAANSTALAIFWSPAAVLVGYGIARAGSSAFNELRTAVFSKIALRTIRTVSRQVFSHLHELDLRYHLRYGLVNTL
ncbi:ABC transporter of the mitochondrion 3 [Actinidia rufa]|uniref:ABC transporter of the mitochondrion 3 n=1 Tax=Actinidia rufa TaxID=165716 RepID=A0A7J0GRG2_9ERIC|nr:ABC transporter of the mitochondrion 3 [Actinidia rufa]